MTVFRRISAAVGALPDQPACCEAVGSPPPFRKFGGKTRNKRKEHDFARICRLRLAMVSGISSATEIWPSG